MGAAITRALPEPVAEGVARVVGWGVSRVASERRAQVERNLRRVSGDRMSGIALQRAAAATFESYARYYVESFRLPGTSPEDLDARMSYTGLAHVDRALARGKGLIIALPHLGPWEWAGFWVNTVLGVPTTVVVEALEPPDLFEWFADLRRSMGMNVVALGPEAGTAVARALKANHIVCLLCDRGIGGSGVEVEFFGEKTRLPAGPATLALRSGAPILPTAIYQRGKMHHGVVRAPLATDRRGKLRDDVARVTQDLARELEILIRAAPEQWHLLQPNWPSDPGYRAEVQR